MAEPGHAVKVTVLTFLVAGIPAPQGSKTAWIVGRRAVLFDSNAKKLQPWRAAVAGAAQAAHAARAPLEGALYVDVQFRFVRPKTVRRLWPSVRPDVDKLARGLLDALTVAAVWGDDAQVVDLHATKIYAAEPGAFVRVGQINEKEKT